MMKKIRNKSKGKSLSERFAAKKRKKAAKLGLFLYKCVGGAHQPQGCGNEWSSNPLRGHPEGCPKCGNKYYKWLNFPNV